MIQNIALLNLGTRLNQVKEASILIKSKNKLQTTIIDMRFAKPIDTQLLKNLQSLESFRLRSYIKLRDFE